MITIVRPYEPPPDYPIDEDTDENDERRKSAQYCGSHKALEHGKSQKNSSDEMLRTRQYPEIAGLYCGEEQIPALRRFTRYNQSMTQRDLAPATVIIQPCPSVGKSKKSSFTFGNWTFRDKKNARPPLSMEQPKREERPASVNLSDVRSIRSRSEGARLVEERYQAHKAPAPSPSQASHDSCRIPIRMERVPLQESVRSSANRVFFRSQPPPQHKIPLQPPPVEASSRPQSHVVATENLRSNCQSFVSDSGAGNLSEHRVSKKKNNRRREKSVRDGWKTKALKDWSLDDILVWLQVLKLDDAASVLVGYDLKGTDLLTWDDTILAHLGIHDVEIRNKILFELDIIKKSNDDSRHSIFDLVRNTACDQVLAFETALTPRDVSVTGGRLGCLQVTKVDGSRLPLKMNDCLLEINGIQGEQFKSALMLTKLISDADGKPIRFVVLRRKERDDDSASQAESSSGVSSSPMTPIDNRQ